MKTALADLALPIEEHTRPHNGSIPLDNETLGGDLAEDAANSLRQYNNSENIRVNDQLKDADVL
jgi:hypothetical protein